MNILCVSGSPRKGNTEFLVERLVDALKNNGNVEAVYLSETKLEYCDGCLECDETGCCHINDNMNDILGIVKSSDIIVFATPARWALLSAPLKNFIDRLNPLAGSGLLNGKKAIIIGLGQTEGEDAVGIKKAVDSVQYFVDDAGMETIGTCIIEGVLNPNDLFESNKVNVIINKVIALL